MDSMTGNMVAYLVVDQVGHHVAGHGVHVVVGVLRPLVPSSCGRGGGGVLRRRQNGGGEGRVEGGGRLGTGWSGMEIWGGGRGWAGNGGDVGSHIGGVFRVPGVGGPVATQVLLLVLLLLLLLVLASRLLPSVPRLLLLAAADSSRRDVVRVNLLVLPPLFRLAPVLANNAAVP